MARPANGASSVIAATLNEHLQKIKPIKGGLSPLVTAILDGEHKKIGAFRTDLASRTAMVRERIKASRPLSLVFTLLSDRRRKIKGIQDEAISFGR